MYHEENGVYLRMPEIHPTMIIDNTNKIIVLENSKDNVNLFFEKYGKMKQLKDFNIKYMYEKDILIEIEELKKEEEIKKEKERQERLRNPEIYKDILNISSKEELIYFLLEEFYFNNLHEIYEYSNDEEIDKVELSASYNKLEELTNKFL